MRPNQRLFINLFVAIFILILYGEYLIFYLYQGFCSYPDLDSTKADDQIEVNDEETLRLMVLSDPHILGRRAHWLDKMRREWQMYRSFQTAMTLHKPDVVFILGDLLDEGANTNMENFKKYVTRFRSIFALPEGTEMFITVGNHDVGFHYWVTPYLNERFKEAFNVSEVEFLTIKNNHFILINSMALEGDGCFLCKPAEQKLAYIERSLKCSQGILKNCDNITSIGKYSRPILLQHFPLYRTSDEKCNEPDSMHYPEKIKRYRDKIDAISKEATYQILKQTDPRLAISGHTHFGCILPLANNRGIEITIPSFSWRNIDNPSYSLLTVTPNNYAFSRCALPKESVLYGTYIFGMLLILVLLGYSLYRNYNKKKYHILLDHKEA